MNLTELMRKRLILLSGKGGVGKTTVALLLALSAARMKKRVLLVEMNSTERVAPYFGLKEIGHQEIPLSPYLTGINLKPSQCFEEYVLKQIRFRKMFDVFINNRFVTYFLNAVPGFNELLMVGKIYDYERQQKSKFSKQKLYDLIIVDGPATGHGVSAFEVPHVVKNMVRLGPLKKQAENILKLLTNAKKCAFSVVSLAEEMPVAEASELVNMVNKKLKIALGPLLLNNFHQTSLTAPEYKKISSSQPEASDKLFGYYAYAKLSYERAGLNEFYLKELKKRNPGLNIVQIPHLEGSINSIDALKPLLESL